MDLEKSFDVALAKRRMKKKDFAAQQKVTAAYITQVTTNGSLSVSKLDKLANDLGYKLWEFIKLGEPE